MFGFQDSILRRCLHSFKKFCGLFDFLEEVLCGLEDGQRSKDSFLEVLERLQDPLRVLKL